MNAANAISAKSANERQAARSRRALTSDLLILEDGTLLAHNLTPAIAEVLRKVSPRDERLQLHKTAKRPAGRQSVRKSLS